MDMAGGSADNAIPSASHAQIFACEKECAALEESLKSFEEILRREFSVTDPGISITVAGKEQGEWEAFTKESTKKAEMLLFMMPNGIQAMSADIKGLVQTSLNLGILKMADGVLELDYSVRSSVIRHLKPRYHRSFVNGRIHARSGDFKRSEHVELLMRQDIGKDNRLYLVGIARGGFAHGNLHHRAGISVPNVQQIAHDDIFADNYRGSVLAAVIG